MSETKTFFGIPIKKMQWTVFCQGRTKGGTSCCHYHNVWLPIGKMPKENWRCRLHRKKAK